MTRRTPLAMAAHALLEAQRPRPDYITPLAAEARARCDAEMSTLTNGADVSKEFLAWAAPLVGELPPLPGLELA